MHIELTDVSLKLCLSVMTSRGVITRRDGVVVQVTEYGISGWGEALPLPGWPGADLGATRRALEQWADDPDPTSLPSERFAHGAVELALLDLEARRTGRTQAEVLADAGLVADSVELNALVGDAGSAESAVAAGYRTVKMKVGAAGLDEDLASVAAVRDAIGLESRLRLDANGAWAADEAVTALSELAQFDVEYIEEPVAGVEALAQLAEHSPIPVAMDDSLGSAEGKVPESIPVVVVKPMALGGPRTAYAAACRFIDQGHKVIVTNYLDSAIGQHAALSVASALPGPTQIHGAVTPALFAIDIADPPRVTNGRCHLPPHSPAPKPQSR